MRSKSSRLRPAKFCGFAVFLCGSLLSQVSFAADSSGSAAPASRQLKGGATDQEHMGQSVKLLVPAPPAPPPPPRQLQSGLQSGIQQATPAPFFKIPASTRAPFQLGTQVNPWLIRHPDPPRPYVNYGSYPTIVPQTPVYRPIVRQPLPPPLPPPPPPIPVWRSQIDVVAVSEPYRVTEMANLETAIKRIHVEPLTTHIEAKPLQAQEMTLPGSKLPAAASWEEWYKRVAKAIYDRWSQNTAGPGAATISITVFNSHYVDCRITEFTPAVGADRNVDMESKFKQTALDAIKTLSGDPLWGFPVGAKASLKQIVFEMELKHSVGETAGCKVVHLHDGS